MDHEVVTLSLNSYIHTLELLRTPRSEAIAPISIRGNQLDSTDSRLAVSSAEHVLIKFTNTLDNTILDNLNELKIEIQQNLGNDIWLCHNPSKDLTNVKKLNFIAFAVVYHSLFKTQSDLKNVKDLRNVGIALHEDAYSALDDTKVHVQSLATTAQFISSANGLIQLKVNAQVLDKIAELESVKAIEVLQPIAPMNDRMQAIVKTKEMNDSRNLLAGKLTGKGEVVAITDTGLDTKHTAFLDRIVKTIVLDARNPSMLDVTGHGTHCAATMMGAVKAQDWKLAPNEMPQGVAPGAKLVAQSYLAQNTMVPQPPTIDPIELMRKPYSDYNARVHSNSWTVPLDEKSPVQAIYSSNDAEKLDEVAYKCPDLLLIFSAGNDGNLVTPTLKGHIGGHAAAKNIITVGASTSDRLVDFRSDGSDKVNVNAITRRDINTVAAFSNRGPTLEGRLKPDVIAPGTAVLSARSKDLSPAMAVKLEGLFGSSDATKSGQWMFDCGTSMATPAVAGCAALLREALSDPVFKLAPQEITSALLKALLINGTVDITASQTGPDITQGFGRIDMQRAIRPLLQKKEPSPPFTFVQSLASGADTVKPKVIESMAPATATAGRTINFKATLVYIDSPGAALQQKITLQAALSAGPPTIDNKPNNVRQVLLKNVPPGSKVFMTITFDIYRQTHWAVVWDFYEV